MAKLVPRYSAEDLARLRELIHSEERRYEFTKEPWTGEGFRHWTDLKITPIEYFWPKQKQVLPGAWKPRRRA